MSPLAEYVRIQPGVPLPSLKGLQPFRAIVIVEDQVSAEWQASVSDWLVRSGCLYMLAWGENCSTWDDSVDLANVKQFESGSIPDDKFVMTTWHDNESLNEVFWFAKHNAVHPNAEIKRTVLIHISSLDKSENLSVAYADA